MMRRILKEAAFLGASGLLAAFLGASWFNLAMYHGIPAPKPWVWADGERGYDLWTYQLIAVCFIVIICTRISILAGISLRRGIKDVDRQNPR